jgi:hypothetical protein
MTTVRIPAWNEEGVLPPVDPEDHSGTTDLRAPYVVDLVDFVTRFATSPERREILKGFLDYRAALHATGLIRGFQWLNGSFTENVEVLEARPPRDIDVVTFVDFPEDSGFPGKLPDVFDPWLTRARYRVDGYYVETGFQPPEALVERIAYWYSMWSHRRDGLWKGFLQLDLYQARDADAREWLMLNAGEVQS